MKKKRSTTSESGTAALHQYYSIMFIGSVQDCPSTFEKNADRY